MPPPEKPFVPPEEEEPGIRYVLYSEEKGVFLGDGHWSNINPGYDNSAITYNEKWANHYVWWFKENEQTECRKIQVETDMDFNLISPKALEEQGLPTWVPDPPPKKKQRR
jgi:hypothetical protein